MGLEQVKNEILGNANEEAKRIAEAGKREAEEIMRKADGEIEKSRKSAEDDTRKLIEAMERKAISSAEFDVKKMKLDRKKDIIDRVFGNVKKDLGSLGEKDREAGIRSLLAKAKKEIEVKYVHASPKDKSLIGKIPNVVYKETDIMGGIVAETQDLSLCVDFSYDAMLDEVRKKHLQEIAKILFG